MKKVVPSFDVDKAQGARAPSIGQGLGGNRQVLLEARKLGFTVGRGPGAKDLVRDVSLDLVAGECTGIIGPNGAGKTTLLRLLSGWLKPTHGEVILKGRGLETYRDQERASILAMMTQDIPSSFPFSVTELVSMGRYPWTTGRGQLSTLDRAMVRDIIAYVGLEAQANQPFPQLSGGEKQRALFARTMAQSAQVYLLDEPSASMDMAQEHKLFGMVRELAREGAAVAMAVHSINTACEYCDRLVVVHDGHIVAQGSPQDVVTQESMKRWFDVSVHIGKNEATGSILISHVPEKPKTGSHRVHVIGGAGSARNVTRLLVRLGYEVSGGIAHGLDHDSALWETLGVPQVRVHPFSHIDDGAFAEARAMVEASGACVLCDFPLGPGNKRNMDLLRHASMVWFLESEGPPLDSPNGGCNRAFWLPGLEEEFYILVGELEAAGRLRRVTYQEFSHLAEHYQVGA